MLRNIRIMRDLSAAIGSIRARAAVTLHLSSGGRRDFLTHDWTRFDTFFRQFVCAQNYYLQLDICAQI